VIPDQGRRGGIMFWNPAFKNRFLRCILISMKWLWIISFGEFNNVPLGKNKLLAMEMLTIGDILKISFCHICLLFRPGA